MLGDLRLGRELGLPGGLLLGMIALSSFISIKSWVETPINRALAHEGAKSVDWNVFGPDGKAKFEAQMQNTMRQVNSQMNIDFPGTILWSAGFVLMFFKSLWGPKTLLVGAPFKIWSNLLGHDVTSVAFDIAVLLLALVILFRWKQPEAN